MSRHLNNAWRKDMNMRRESCRVTLYSEGNKDKHVNNVILLLLQIIILLWIRKRKFCKILN